MEPQNPGRPADGQATTGFDGSPPWLASLRRRKQFCIPKPQKRPETKPSTHLEDEMILKWVYGPYTMHTGIIVGYGIPGRAIRP